MSRGAATVAVLAALAAASPAHAAAQREVCVRTATLLTSPPDGIPVATLMRGEPVLVMRRGENRAWVRVKTNFGPRGWLRAAHLCRPR